MYLRWLDVILDVSLEKFSNNFHLSKYSVFVEIGNIAVGKSSLHGLQCINHKKMNKFVL